RPDRTHGGDLCARLLSSADDGKRVRIRFGQELGRNSARRARAHLPEQIGLDDRLELAVERGVEERVKLPALHPGIGLEPVHPLRAIGSAHQVEGAAASRARCRGRLLVEGCPQAANNASSVAMASLTVTSRPTSASLRY